MGKYWSVLFTDHEKAAAIPIERSHYAILLQSTMLVGKTTFSRLEYCLQNKIASKFLLLIFIVSAIKNVSLFFLLLFEMVLALSPSHSKEGSVVYFSDFFSSDECRRVTWWLNHTSSKYAAKVARIFWIYQRSSNIMTSFIVITRLRFRADRLQSLSPEINHLSSYSPCNKCYWSHCSVQNSMMKKKTLISRVSGI